MKEYIEKEKTYEKISEIAENLTSFLTRSNLGGKEWTELDTILNKLLQLKFYIYDAPSTQIIEIPYKLEQKYYVKVGTCSCGGYEKKGNFYPSIADCIYKCKNMLNCDFKFIVKEETFNSINEKFGIKNYEGKTFWLYPEEVPL